MRDLVSAVGTDSQEPTAPALARLARDLIPGGSPTAVPQPDGELRIIARGFGSRVWDLKGTEYIDYLLGSGPMILGHSHPAVVDAVKRQAELGTSFYGPTESLIALAARMVELIPCADMIQFCASGAEATHYAMRIARAATGRETVLKFEGGFHGTNDYASMSVFPRTPANYPLPEPSSGGVSKLLEQEVLIAPYNDLDVVTAIAQANTERLAAIIVEPYQRTIDPVPGFLEGLRQVATRTGAVLIFDEVVTGFRFALGGAQAYYGVVPDLATYGKIIGGGFPLAAVAGRAALLRLADPARKGEQDYVWFSGTLSGNPVAAAAGLATLSELEQPGVYERLFEAGERLRAGLRRCFSDAGVAAQVAGTGPLFQVFLTDASIVDYRSTQQADAVAARRLAEGMLKRGVLYTGEKGYIGLAHSDEELDLTVETVADALAGVVR
jgi:glutamate-1-semialdehyde 2,1-aminomutase